MTKGGGRRNPGGLFSTEGLLCKGTSALQRASSVRKASSLQKVSFLQSSSLQRPSFLLSSTFLLSEGASSLQRASYLQKASSLPRNQRGSSGRTQTFAVIYRRPEELRRALAVRLFRGPCPDVIFGIPVNFVRLRRDFGQRGPSPHGGPDSIWGLPKTPKEEVGRPVRPPPG